MEIFSQPHGKQYIFSLKTILWGKKTHQQNMIAGELENTLIV
jgi:hypothetical protein